MKAEKVAILTMIGIVMMFVLPSITVICVATTHWWYWWFLGVPIFVGGASILTFGILGLEKPPWTESSEPESVYRDYAKVGRVVVVEQKPMMRTTLWGTDSGTEIYGLAFPYVIFVISLDKIGAKYYFYRMYVYYRNKPLSSISKMLYRPNLPNIYPSCRVCMRSRGVKESRFPFQVARKAIEVFWGSEFNSDLPELFEAGKWLSLELRSLATWKRASKKKSSFPLEIQWREACTLSEAIRRAEYGD